MSERNREHLFSPSFLQSVEDAAKAGDPHAQLRLGDAHYFGDGVLKDDRDAVIWYRKAAGAGHAKAQAAAEHLAPS